VPIDRPSGGVAGVSGVISPGARVPRVVWGFVRRFWSGSGHESAKIIFGAVLFAVLAFALWRGVAPRSSPGVEEGRAGMGLEVSPDDAPRRVPTLARRVFPANCAEDRLVRALLGSPPSVPLDGAAACHFLRAYGLGPIPNSALQSGRLTALAMLDGNRAKQLFGKPLFYQTRYGVRSTLALPDRTPGKTGAGEAHRDQCLAAFAEAGLPLSTPIRTSSGVFSIRAVLDDSVLNFKPDEEEIHWTAIAYCLYLPAQTAWRNRDGERFGFDDLANELMRRPLGEASCGGAHLLYALTLLLRVDREAPRLSQPVRQAVEQRLRKCVATAMGSQAADGWFALDWFQPGALPPRIANPPLYRLIATGHIVEWMQYLPEDLQPAQAVYVRAAAWLHSELTKMMTGSFEASQFCA